MQSRSWEDADYSPFGTYPDDAPIPPIEFCIEGCGEVVDDGFFLVTTENQQGFMCPPCFEQMVQADEHY